MEGEKRREEFDDYTILFFGDFHYGVSLMPILYRLQFFSKGRGLFRGRRLYFLQIL